jgi:hypothetical protein
MLYRQRLLELENLVKRVLLITLGVVVANVAALVMFWLFVSIALMVSTTKPWLDVFLDGLFLVGLFGTFIVFTTIFPVSLTLAYIGLLFRWTHRWIYVGGGALIGLAFIIFVYQGSSLSSAVDKRNALFFICIGVVCGWIYWRIAIRQTPNPCDAIDGP